MGKVLCSNISKVIFATFDEDKYWKLITLIVVYDVKSGMTEEYLLNKHYIKFDWVHW